MTTRKIPAAAAARPAETTTLAGGVAALIAWRLGVPTSYIAPIALGLSAVPAAITGLVTHGGIRGTALAIWRGH